MTSDGFSLYALQFEGQRHEWPRTGCAAGEALPLHQTVMAWLHAYFEGRPTGALPPLARQGTAFQLCVWRQLLQIPYGEVVTYGELAQRVAAERGCPRMSAQAVGQAVGHNPIALLVPCHRVVGSNRQLVGYAAGVDKKSWLLEHEARLVNALFDDK